MRLFIMPILDFFLNFVRSVGVCVLIKFFGYKFEWKGKMFWCNFRSLLTALPIETLNLCQTWIYFRLNFNVKTLQFFYWNFFHRFSIQSEMASIRFHADLFFWNEEMIFCVRFLFFFWSIPLILSRSTFICWSLSVHDESWFYGAFANYLFPQFWLYFWCRV